MDDILYMYTVLWFQIYILATCFVQLLMLHAMYAIILSARYVLLHHVMGELEGIKGAWGYVRGGMGALSDAIASSAKEKGVEIFTDCVCV